jgi:hypothetical protein
MQPSVADGSLSLNCKIIHSGNLELAFFEKDKANRFPSWS